MTKYIKRAGTVFFVLVISLLLFIGIILTLNATNSNEDFSDLENKDIQTVAEKYYSLSGSTYDKANTWNEAVTYSVNNSATVEVRLLSDWTTEYDRSIYVYTFGFGSGFTSNGGIYVPAGAKITLNLNGYSLIGVGNMIDFISIYGQLTISYSPSETKDYLREILTGNVTGSKLTGTNLSGNPLIRVSGSSARFYFNGGYITGNSVYVSGSTNYGFISVENGAFCQLSVGGIYKNSVSGSINNSYIYAAVKGPCSIGDIVIIEDYNANMSGINADGGKININSGGDGYIYGSSKYDIYLDDNSKIEFLGSHASGVYGVSATPGRFFTKNYPYLASGNPMKYFKFKNPNISEHFAVVANSTSEVKFVPKSQMTIITKPTRGTSSNYIIEYGTTYYPVGYDASTMNIDGAYGSSIGTHTAKLEPKSGYLWKDSNKYEELIFQYQVVKKRLVKPTLITSTYVYNGGYMKPQWNNYANAYFTSSGEVSKKNVGTYVVTISLKSPDNSCWSDNTTTPISFEWRITEKPIEKPLTGNNVFLFSDSAYEYMPEGFVSSQMTISNNIQTNVGKYKAIIALKPNYKWADDTMTALEFDYEIILPGIIVEDNLNWDYLYLQNNFRKSYSVNYIHRLNDSNVALADGKTRYVIGNINANTKISTFLDNIGNDIKLIKIYNQYDNIIYDGIASNGEIIESVGKQLIATGFRVELFENVTATTAFDTVYLSVLGDINGDGRITAMDLAIINEMAKDDNVINSMEIEYQLAALVNNKGGITSVDSEILNNVMSGELDLNLFINAEINENTNYTYLILNKENGKYERVVSETATNVIGNISIGTKVSEFKAKLATLGVNTAQIAIYNNQNTQVTDDNAIVGTGWYYEINGSQRTYISVLGDLNGDGRISASDMMYLNELMSSDLNNAEDYIIISALILNTGNITSADRAVLKVVFENKNMINNY